MFKTMVKCVGLELHVKLHAYIEVWYIEDLNMSVINLNFVFVVWSYFVISPYSIRNLKVMTYTVAYVFQHWNRCLKVRLQKTRELADCLCRGWNKNPQRLCKLSGASFQHLDKSPLRLCKLPCLSQPWGVGFTRPLALAGDKVRLRPPVDRQHGVELPRLQGGARMQGWGQENFRDDSGAGRQCGASILCMRKYIYIYIYIIHI